MSPPLIGVTTSEIRRAEVIEQIPEAEPRQHEMALGMPYVRALERAGAVPIVLPPVATGLVPALMRSLDGLCLSGGPDLDPTAYGAVAHPELGPVEPSLDAFEVAVASQADAAGLPLLGICRGCQTLNIVRGGSLVQHLPDVVDGSIAHRQADPGWVTTHHVDVAPGSRLAQALGRDSLAVNSFHHQAVERLGAGLRAVAWSPDGTIEGIEGDDEDRLVLGVQWHAETLDEVDDANGELFRTFAEHCRQRALAGVR